jgi:hypothetical protein
LLAFFVPHNKSNQLKNIDRGEVIIYRATDGNMAIDVRFEKESVWLTINQISDLFGRDKSVVSSHLSNIYREGELDRTQTVAKNATVQAEGDKQVTREIEYYNLDAIYQLVIGSIRKEALSFASGLIKYCANTWPRVMQLMKNALKINLANLKISR